MAVASCCQMVPPSLLIWRASPLYLCSLMKPESIKSPLARIAFAFLSAMWTATGWYLFFTKTFSTTPPRSKSTTIVVGYEAQFMGLILVALGLIAMTILLRSLSLSRAVEFALLCTVLVVSPLAMQAALGMR